MKKNLRIPSYDKKLQLWTVNIGGEMVCGNLENVLSNYIDDKLIYEYNSDGKCKRFHEFNELLICIIYDLSKGKSVNFDGYERDYSEQELSYLNKLVDKIMDNKNKFEDEFSEL